MKQDQKLYITESEIIDLFPLCFPSIIKRFLRQRVLYSKVDKIDFYDFIDFVRYLEVKTTKKEIIDWLPPIKTILEDFPTDVAIKQIKVLAKNNRENKKFLRLLEHTKKKIQKIKKMNAKLENPMDIKSLLGF